MRMLSSTIGVLAHARDAERDPFEALDTEIGWDRLLAAKPIAAELGRKADEDPLVKACERYMTVHKHRHLGTSRAFSSPVLQS